MNGWMVTGRNGFDLLVQISQRYFPYIFKKVERLRTVGFIFFSPSKFSSFTQVVWNLFGR